jgi:hypothetical protein
MIAGPGNVVTKDSLQKFYRDFIGIKVYRPLSSRTTSFMVGRGFRGRSRVVRQGRSWVVRQGRSRMPMGKKVASAVSSWAQISGFRVGRGYQTRVTGFR